MATTIIEWTGEEPFTPEENLRNENDAEAIAGSPLFRKGDNFILDEIGNKVVTRRWPSQAVAEAWIAHVAQWGPVSAVVVPD